MKNNPTSRLAFLRSRTNTLRATISLLYHIHPRAFWVSALASLGEPLFYPILLLLVQRLLELIAANEGNGGLAPGLTLTGLGLVGIVVGQRLAIIIRDASSTILRQKAWVLISERIMHKLPTVPYSLFENNTFQAQYGLVIRDASYRSITLVDSLLSTVPVFLGLVGLAIVLFSLAPFVVLAMAAIAIPAALVERRFSHAMYELQERSAPGRLRLEALTNMQVDALWQRDVRVYQSNLIAQEHAALAESYLAMLQSLTGRFLGLRSAAALAEGLGLAITLILGYLLLSRDQLSLTNLAVLLPGLALLFGMTQAAIWHYRTLLESLNYAEALFDFLAQSFAGLGTGLKNNIVAGSPRLAAICLQDVSYIYPETGKVALSGISCTFKPGLTAIVGANGAGKSTLVKILSGLVSPTSGTVTAVLDSGEEIPVSAYNKAVLFQDPAHFYFKIGQNVTMRPEWTTEEAERIAAVLHLAGLTNVVQALPQGMDTIVGAGFGGSADLSGGQWQRLALARLLYHDASLLILDEPSANLDAAGEQQVFELLSRLAQEKIILFTTHHYNTIRKAETIVVLTDGQIAEMGTHDELVRNARDFFSLYLGQGVRSSS
jgi:ATP-binding cassette, subfamily B, bacterial